MQVCRGWREPVQALFCESALPGGFLVSEKACPLVDWGTRGRKEVAQELLMSSFTFDLFGVLVINRHRMMEIERVIDAGLLWIQSECLSLLFHLL